MSQERLLALAERQLAELESVPLAELTAGRGLAAPATELIELLLAERAQVGPWLAGAGPAKKMAERLARWLWHKNQYVRLDRAALTAACSDALADMSKEIGEAEGAEGLARGLVRVFAGLQGKVAEMVRGSAGERPREVVCSEYAPTLQLDALGLEIEGLRAPILDVGCGKSAVLVRALRARGLAATGIDREGQDEVAVAADWLTFVYGNDRWGTVLSHQAFSLHFLHQHLGQQPQAYAHAQAYMAIVRSLVPGGMFAYVPGLPFIERLLPGREFRCTRVPLHSALEGPAVRALSEMAGFDVAYAAHVERVVG
jgi:hypothetical protein